MKLCFNGGIHSTNVKIRTTVIKVLVTQSWRVRTHIRGRRREMTSEKLSSDLYTHPVNAFLQSHTNEHAHTIKRNKIAVVAHL